MKEVLCYGDSNTWGYNPENKERYDRETRWTGVMQQALGEDYYVIEEGLNGRTTVWEDPIELHKNGSTYLPPCLETHKPLDLVIIMLGTNDLKVRFSVSAYDIAKSMGTLIEIVKKSNCGLKNGAPEILILAPPPLGKLTEYAEMLTGGIEKSKKLARYYSEIAEEYNVHFFDTSSVIKSSDIDGVHFEKEAHSALGKALAEVVKKIV